MYHKNFTISLRLQFYVNGALRRVEKFLRPLEHNWFFFQRQLPVHIEKSGDFCFNFTEDQDIKVVQENHCRVLTTGQQYYNRKNPIGSRKRYYQNQGAGIIQWRWKWLWPTQISSPVGSQKGWLTLLGCSFSKKFLLTIFLNQSFLKPIYRNNSSIRVSYKRFNYKTKHFRRKHLRHILNFSSRRKLIPKSCTTFKNHQSLSELQWKVFKTPPIHLIRKKPL